MVRLLAMLVVVLLFTGCGSVTPVDFDGSRADGTIDMGVSFGPYQTFDGDWTVSEHIVLERCQAWGYIGFQAFSGHRERCFTRGLFGECTSGELLKTYQCTNPN